MAGMRLSGTPLCGACVNARFFLEFCGRQAADVDLSQNCRGFL
jgi:hypothetical protein